MRLATYQSDTGPRTVALGPRGPVDLNRANPQIPYQPKQLLAQWHQLRAASEAAALQAAPLEQPPVWRAPIPDPGKVICIGLNYADHAAESGAEIPAEPVVFCKFPTAVIAHEQPIRLPAVSQKVDYEAELVVVIGRGGRNIPPSEAFAHVAGYTCGHDVSARDWQLQKPGGQWLLGKTFDTFAPMGPHLVTADEIDDPHQLEIALRLNGQTMQHSTTQQLIFPIDFLIHYLSQICTLEPGDVIFTGTPPGVGAARRPPVYLKSGDVAEVEIQGIGVLRNPVE